MDAEKQRFKESALQKLKELSSFGDKASVDLFLECLAHPYQYIRIDAVRQVSKHGRKEFIWFFGMALNDKYDGVVDEAAQALAKLNTDEALEILSNALFEGTIERPHHITSAISQFGQRGFDVLLKGTKSSSPNIRYYSAHLLGSTGFESAEPVLEDMANNDHEKTTFSGLVSTGAKKGLKTLLKKLNNAPVKYINS